MNARSVRAVERMHPVCPICRQRIANRDQVTRLRGRGFVHTSCAKNQTVPSGSSP